MPKHYGVDGIAQHQRVKQLDCLLWPPHIRSLNAGNENVAIDTRQEIGDTPTDTLLGHLGFSVLLFGKLQGSHMRHSWAARLRPAQQPGYSNLDVPDLIFQGRSC